MNQEPGIRASSGDAANLKVIEKISPDVWVSDTEGCVSEDELLFIHKSFASKNSCQPEAIRVTLVFFSLQQNTIFLLPQPQCCESKHRIQAEFHNTKTLKQVNLW